MPKPRLKTSRFWPAPTEERGGKEKNMAQVGTTRNWAHFPVHVIAGAVGLVAVVVGSVVVAEQVFDDDDGATSAATTVVSGPEADAIGRFAQSTDFTQAQAELDATSRFNASADQARAVREQDAILRLQADTSLSFPLEDAILRFDANQTSSSFPLEDAILRFQASEGPAGRRVVTVENSLNGLRLATASTAEVREQDAILRMAAGDGEDREQDAILRWADN
jgi:hypothetical protein